VAIVAFAVSAVMASVTFTPPDSSKPVDMATIKLEPQKAAPKASGTASLICNKDNTKHVLTIEAKGLDPKKVYTVWFTKMSGKKMDMAGVGKAPYVLKVDKNGVGKMTYKPTKCPTTQGWQMVEIVDHVDKNAKNMDMKNLVPVLMGKMPMAK
jgi:hypothetical protein